MRWFHAIRARMRLLFARRAAEERMDEEFRFHVEMEADRLVREEGLEPKEARRRALVTFGGVEEHREAMREGRGLAWLSGLVLDLKLGVRMLLKYPVLTVAGVLALAMAVTLAASWFEFTTDFTHPRIPLDDADRIVTIRNRDLAVVDRDASSEPRSLHDFEIWRDEVESIEDLTALSRLEYNVRTEDGRFTTLEGAPVTPSMFRLVRMQPLLGRPLTEEDNRADAPPVAVLGYSAWQRLFDGDRSAIGRTIRLGSEQATVVGVMPEGFGFPVNQEIWTPLREGASSYGRREGPPISINGRLAPGSTMEQAQAELTAIGQRMAAEFPDTHERLRPEVERFAQGGWERIVVTGLNIPFLLFLVVVSANVATLLFARTATRETEIALRSALGASRRRIVLQLVAEALVLTTTAAALGLVAARWGLRWGMDLFWEVQQMRPPFWWDSGLSATTALYVGVLAVAGALIIGGVPGLRATRRPLRHRLGQPGASGSGMRFGGTPTVVIVAQVAICVAFIPVAIMSGQDLLRERGGAEPFPAETYLTGRLTRQPDRPERTGDGPAGQDGQDASGPASAELFDDVLSRLAAQPGVLAATRANRLPGFNHPVEPIGIGDDSMRTVAVRTLAVDPNFFEVLGARIVDGRSFGPADVAGSARVAIVDRDWAAETFGGSAIGRRIQYPSEGELRADRWYEIVGVVDGMERVIGPGTPVTVFRPLFPAEHASVRVYMRTAGLPDALVPDVQDLIASLDPRLGTADLMALDDAWRPVERSDTFFAAALAVVGAIILLFALMGIYALMSFTVAQREREIGIRAALGANPLRIVASIFSRAMLQIGMGVVAGAALVSLTIARDPEGLRLVGGVAVAMVVVGLIGCVVPAMRALRIQPTEALRAE